MQIYSLARSQLCNLLSGFELLSRESVELALNLRADLRDLVETRTPYYVLLGATASGLVDLRVMAEAFLEQLVEKGHIVNGAVAASKAQAASFWGMREAMVEAQVRYGRHLGTDVSVPISLISLFVAEADALLAEHVPDALPLLYGHVGNGNIHCNVLPPRELEGDSLLEYLRRCEELIFEVVDRLDGSISAEHGIGISKQRAFFERTSPLDLNLMQEIRLPSDPGSLLSPGRLLPKRVSD